MFSKCVSVEEIKSLYRKLAMENHPDHGGDLEKMKIINAEYQKALKAFDGQTYKDTTTKKSYTYKYDEKIEKEIMSKIYEVLALRMKNVDVMLIGRWLWLKGETKRFKEILKDMGFKWHGKRASWFHNFGVSSRSWTNGSLEDIARKYGCREFAENSVI